MENNLMVLVIRKENYFRTQVWTRQKKACSRAGEPMARGIQCCPNFFISFARPASLYCEEYVYIRVYDCIETIFELPLLPITLRVKLFYTNQERCEVLTVYVTLGRWPGGDWVNT